LLHKACGERAEFSAWNLRAVADVRDAEMVIEVTLPPLSWEWNFRLLEHPSYRVLASGMIKAVEQRQAVPLLAAEISRQIQSVRGIPRLR
jgi:hypothetical protein